MKDKSAVTVILRNISKRNEIARNRKVVLEFLEGVKHLTWKKGRVHIPNFAVFLVRKQKPRRIRNPVDMGWMKLPSAQVVKVRPTESWRRRT